MTPRCPLLCRSVVIVLFAAVVPATAQMPPAKDTPVITRPGNSKASTPEQQRAFAAFAAGKIDDALQILSQAAKSNPNAMPPKVVLARWLAEAGQGPQARLMLEQAAQEDPKHPEVFLTNAHFAFLEGRVTEVILNCQAALEASDNPRWDSGMKQHVRHQARLGLAAAYELRRDYVAALAQLDELLRQSPRDVPLRQRYARILFLLQRAEDAYRELQKCRQDDPAAEPAELVMGQLYAAQYDFERAESWFHKAVQAMPQDVRVRRVLAGYLLDRGRREEARPHLETVQRLDPEGRETRALAGYYARHARDFATARQIFEELVRDYPNYPFAILNLAVLLAESDEEKARQRAVALAENHVRAHPQMADARALLAYTLYKAGRHTDAERVARSTFGLGTISPDAAYFLALALYAPNAPDQTRIDIKNLLQAALGSKEAMLYRAEAQKLLDEIVKQLPPEPKVSNMK